MKTLKKLLLNTPGFKRGLAALYWTVLIPVMAIPAVAQHVTPAIQVTIEIVGVLLTTAGLGHAWLRKLVADGGNTKVV